MGVSIRNTEVGYSLYTASYAQKYCIRCACLCDMRQRGAKFLLAPGPLTTALRWWVHGVKNTGHVMKKKHFKMTRTLTPHPHSDSTFIMRPTPVYTHQRPLPTALIKTDSDHPPFCSGTSAQLIPAG